MNGNKIELTDADTDLINELGYLEEEVDQLLHKIQQHHFENGIDINRIRWMQAGEIDLKKGIMCLVKSIIESDKEFL